MSFRVLLLWFVVLLWFFLVFSFFRSGSSEHHQVVLGGGEPEQGNAHAELSGVFGTHFAQDLAHAIRQLGRQHCQTSVLVLLRLASGVKVQQGITQVLLRQNIEKVVAKSLPLNKLILLENLSTRMDYHLEQEQRLQAFRDSYQITGASSAKAGEEYYRFKAEQLAAWREEY